jgi:hypothetical protein
MIRGPVHLAFRNIIKEAMTHSTSLPPPPLATDVRIRGRCLPLPKAFRHSLGFRGPAKLHASVRQAELELRLNPPCLLKPKAAPPVQPPSVLVTGDALSEAFRQIMEEMNEWALVTEASLNTQGQVAIDQRARHHLGWQTGDRIRVVLEEDHLRLIRVA